MNKQQDPSSLESLSLGFCEDGEDNQASIPLQSKIIKRQTSKI